MSLIDPSTRWWNNYAVRRVAAWGCFSVSMLAALMSGWVFGMEFAGEKGTFFKPAAVSGILILLQILLLLAGMFLYFLSEQGESEFKPRVCFFPIAGLFIAWGLGQLVYGLVHSRPLELTPLSFFILGTLGLVVGEVIIRRLERNHVLRETVQRSGLKARGQVTRALHYSVNYSSVTRVTVVFTDHNGQKRWASQTVGGTVQVGQAVTVRYSPSDLGRSAGVVVEPSWRS